MAEIKTAPAEGQAPKTKKIAKVVVDRALCIGAMSCVVVAPGVFEIDRENKAVLIRKDNTRSSDETARGDLADQEINDETLLLAAKSCPTMAITLFDEDGKPIYPQHEPVNSLDLLPE